MTALALNVIPSKNLTTNIVKQEKDDKKETNQNGLSPSSSSSSSTSPSSSFSTTSPSLINNNNNNNNNISNSCSTNNKDYSEDRFQNAFSLLQKTLEFLVNEYGVHYAFFSCHKSTDKTSISAISSPGMAGAYFSQAGAGREVLQNWSQFCKNGNFGEKFQEVPAFSKFVSNAEIATNGLKRGISDVTSPVNCDESSSLKIPCFQPQSSASSSPAAAAAAAADYLAKFQSAALLSAVKNSESMVNNGPPVFLNTETLASSSSSSPGAALDLSASLKKESPQPKQQQQNIDVNLWNNFQSTAQQLHQQQQQKKMSAALSFNQTSGGKNGPDNERLSLAKENNNNHHQQQQQQQQRPSSSPGATAASIQQTAELAKGSWMCPQCMKVIKYKRNARAHLMSHAAVRPCFSCTRCDQSFTTKWNLKKHLKLNHGIDMEITDPLMGTNLDSPVSGKRDKSYSMYSSPTMASGLNPAFQNIDSEKETPLYGSLQNPDATKALQAITNANLWMQSSLLAEHMLQLGAHFKGTDVTAQLQELQKGLDLSHSPNEEESESCGDEEDEEEEEESASKLQIIDQKCEETPLNLATSSS